MNDIYTLLSHELIAIKSATGLKAISETVSVGGCETYS